MCLGPLQEKVLAQVEAEKKSTPPKPEKKAAKLGTAEQAAEAEAVEEEEEEEDPVEAALSKYGIITENPWEKGVKCALDHMPLATCLGAGLLSQGFFVHAGMGQACCRAKQLPCLELGALQFNI